MLSEQANIKRHSRTDSYITNSSKQDFHTPPATARSLKQEASGDLSLQRNSQQSLKNDNWFVHPEQEDEYDENHLAPAPKQSMFSMNGNKGYNTISRYEDVSDVDDEAEEPMMPEPLRMNPLSQNPPSPLPSPPPTDAFTNNNQKNTPPPSGLQRTLTTTSISTEKTFDRSHSRSGTPKSRYYGNLKAATEGVRSANSPSNSPSASLTKGSSVRNPNHFPSATKQYAVNTPPPVPQHNLVNSPFTLHKKSYTSIKRTGEANYTPVKGQSPRVISRSGVDYINPYEFDDSDLGMPGRRRDVSGKIAEEGRGGGWSGMKQRTVSGVAQAY
jgi:hypothetical protein